MEFLNTRHGEKESVCPARFDSWIRKIPWRRDRLPTPVFMGFPGGSNGKESACSVGDLGSIPGFGRSPGGGHGDQLQYSCLENLHGQRGLVGYSPWGHKESDTSERLSTHTEIKKKSCTKDWESEQLWTFA